MVSIDTIVSQHGPVRIGERTFADIGAVPLGTWASVFVAIMRARADKQRRRRQLRNLSDDQLWDIGVRREEARRDYDKPVWWYRN